MLWRDTIICKSQWSEQCQNSHRPYFSPLGTIRKYFLILFIYFKINVTFVVLSILCTLLANWWFCFCWLCKAALRSALARLPGCWWLHRASASSAPASSSGWGEQQTASAETSASPRSLASGSGAQLRLCWVPGGLGMVRLAFGSGNYARISANTAGSYLKHEWFGNWRAPASMQAFQLGLSHDQITTLLGVQL